MKTRLVRGCALAVAWLSLSPTQGVWADEQADEAETLVVDFLKVGANNPESEARLAEAGVDMAIGVVSLGLTALGVPGSEFALKGLKKLFMGEADEIPAAVEKRMQAIERNVAALQRDLGAVQSNVNKISAGLATNTNADRIDNLAPLKREMRTLARKLTEVPGMSPQQKNNFVEEALALADEYLPGSFSSDPWKWDHLRVTANLQSTRKPNVVAETKPDYNVAFEPYLYAIATLAAVIDETGLRPSESRLKPHIDWLQSFYERTDEIMCSKAAGPRKSPDGACSLTLRCESVFATRTKTFSYGAHLDPNYGAQCRYDPAQWANGFDGVRLDVAKANLGVFDIVGEAIAALNMAGKRQMLFGQSAKGEAIQLFAVDADGRLLRFTHSMVERSVDCSDAKARVDLACAPPVTPRKCEVGPMGTACDLAIAPPPGELAHDLWRAQGQPGTWDQYSKILAFGAGVNVIAYGIDSSGSLNWRLIDTASEPSRIVEAPKPVGSGWSSMTNIFTMGQGLLYGVAANGDLIWYNHTNYGQAVQQTAQWSQRPVGVGWNIFTNLFSPGDGVIYAVKPDGSLMWYRHVGYKTGEGLGAPGTWEGPKQVGTGWNGFKMLFAGPQGAIYAVTNSGELLFYRHVAWEGGGALWNDPVKLADGWGEYKVAFALPQSGPAGPVVK